jgi:hypothetical protein
MGAGGYAGHGADVLHDPNRALGAGGHFALMLFGGPDLCPAGPLRCRYSLASGNGDGSLLAGCGGAVYIDFAERGQGCGYAMEFIGEPHAFILELVDYGLH